MCLPAWFSVSLLKHDIVWSYVKLKSSSFDRSYKSILPYLPCTTFCVRREKVGRPFWLQHVPMVKDPKLMFATLSSVSKSGSALKTSNSFHTVLLWASVESLVVSMTTHLSSTYNSGLPSFSHGPKRCTPSCFWVCDLRWPMTTADHWPRPYLALSSLCAKRPFSLHLPRQLPPEWA